MIPACLPQGKCACGGGGGGHRGAGGLQRAAGAPAPGAPGARSHWWYDKDTGSTTCCAWSNKPFSSVFSRIFHGFVGLPCLWEMRRLCFDTHPRWHWSPWLAPEYYHIFPKPGAKLSCWSDSLSHLQVSLHARTAPLLQRHLAGGIVPVVPGGGSADALAAPFHRKGCHNADVLRRCALCCNGALKRHVRCGCCVHLLLILLWIARRPAHCHEQRRQADTRHG